ncbi:MAG TPA: zinc ribbon domain-containing protein [Gemmatimonadaceae bacterium]|jgi:putative FmdB family regulatory protein|nr:zinc ribbon domain-containing protein [Gemmatimonadaceae bacterium]
MPTYEFRCPLGHEFERFYRSMSAAESQVPCPECGQMAERQVSGGAGLLFKGSGFYLTDYGKDAHKKKAPGDAKPDGAKSDSGSGESAGGGASAGESKTESKASESKPAEPAKAEKPKPSTPKPSGGE